jgi:hypothetical protein
MENEYVDILFDWIINEYKSGRHKRPCVNTNYCKCGSTTEKEGLALGFCRNHNLDCLVKFSHDVAVGAWSFKLLMENLVVFAIEFAADARNFDVSPPPSPKKLQPIRNSKWKDFPDEPPPYIYKDSEIAEAALPLGSPSIPVADLQLNRLGSPSIPVAALQLNRLGSPSIPVVIPCTDSDEWVNVSDASYQLPDYDTINDELENYEPPPFIKTLSTESFDFSDMMAS